LSDLEKKKEGRVLGLCKGETRQKKLAALLRACSRSHDYLHDSGYAVLSTPPLVQPASLHCAHSLVLPTISEIPQQLCTRYSKEEKPSFFFSLFSISLFLSIFVYSFIRLRKI
jgi:hypothetical protein